MEDSVQGNSFTALLGGFYSFEKGRKGIADFLSDDFISVVTKALSVWVAKCIVELGRRVSFLLKKHLC